MHSGRLRDRDRVLQQEEHRVVTLESDGGTVRKTFVGTDDAHLLALATREYERLRRFSTVLSDIDGASCPSPVELCEAPNPSVRMTRARGVPLSQAVRRRMDEREIGWLKRVVAEALTVYVATFSEPYYDFHFRNMLYDASTKQITFLDFGVPDHLMPVRTSLDQLGSVDVSLGNLCGSSLFESLRPRNLHRPRQNQRLLLLAPSVVEALLKENSSAQGALPLPTYDGLRTATGIVFRQSASWGPISHRLWYRLFPAHLRRAQKRLDEVFSGAPVGTHPPSSH